MPKAFMLGVGNLGGAVAERMVDQQIFSEGIVGTYTRQPGELKMKWVQTATPDALKAYQEADVVFIGVKPGQFQQVAVPYQPHTNKKDTTVVSLMAALDPKYVGDRLDTQNVAWAMTNLAARQGNAMTAICPSPELSSNRLAQVQDIAQSWGDVINVPADKVQQMHIFTGSVGSGTAFVGRMLELVQSELEAQGTSAAEARNQVLNFAENVLREFKANPTQAYTNYRGAFPGLMEIAINAAGQRSQTMAEHLKTNQTPPVMENLNFNPRAPLFTSAIQGGRSPKQIIGALYINNLEANQSAGFSPDDAKRMSEKTWSGAVQLFRASPDKPIADIYKEVISVQGTTWAGLKATEPRLALGFTR